MPFAPWYDKIQIMNRKEIIEKIEHSADDADLTIVRSARFKKRPLKSLYFYTLVAVNRYTPFLYPIKADSLWGHSLKAYETSAIGSMYYLGFYDSEISLFLLKHFNRSGDILDIGSNIGTYTSLFTQVADPQAKIVAFEPTPSTFGVLKSNVGYLPQVSLEQIAISGKNGDTIFFDYGNRYGVFNSTEAQPLKFLQDKGSKINVKTETLDSWCARTDTKPSLIKLDTEGTEADILSSAHTTLTTYKPVILLEVGGGEAWSENNNRSLDILASHGYLFYTATSLGELLPHKRQSSYQYMNLIAIHKDNANDYATTS